MRQRVGFARALVVHPDVLLMDEPFSALDVLTAETLRTDFLDLWSEGQLPIASVLMVTHNIEEAVLMCDRILIFSSNPGAIAAEIQVMLPHPRNRLDPRFTQLAINERKRLFASQLLTYVPLAAHIRRVLDERPNHAAPLERFKSELEDHMREDLAEQTLRAVISWARYAEAFSYDEDTH